MRENDCEIESLGSRKRKVVHANNLRRFVVDAADPLNEDSEDMLSSDSEESTIEYVEDHKEPMVKRNR